jgi:hypothetical protein
MWFPNDQDFLAKGNGAQMRLTVIDYSFMMLTLTLFVVLVSAAACPPLMSALVWMVAP